MNEIGIITLAILSAIALAGMIKARRDLAEHARLRKANDSLSRLLATSRGKLTAERDRALEDAQNARDLSMRLTMALGRARRRSCGVNLPPAFDPETVEGDYRRTWSNRGSARINEESRRACMKTIEAHEHRPGVPRGV